MKINIRKMLKLFEKADVFWQTYHRIGNIKDDRRLKTSMKLITRVFPSLWIFVDCGYSTAGHHKTSIAQKLTPLQIRLEYPFSDLNLTFLKKKKNLQVLKIISLLSRTQIFPTILFKLPQPRLKTSRKANQSIANGINQLLQRSQRLSSSAASFRSFHFLSNFSKVKKRWIRMEIPWNCMDDRVISRVPMNRADRKQRKFKRPAPNGWARALFNPHWNRSFARGPW